MSTTNSPIFDSNIDLNNNADSSQNSTPVIDNAGSPQSPPQAPRKITKKQEKENERAAKKQAKEDAKKAIEDEKTAKKQAKEDAKKAKEDEKTAKKQAKENAKKAKELAKKRTKLLKKAREDEKATKKVARQNKKNTNVSSEVPTQVSSELSSEVPTQVPSELSSELSSEVPLEVSSEVPSEVSSHVPTQVSSEVSSLKPLPAKSLKFIEFAYFLIKHFENAIPSLPIDHLFSLARTFDSPSSQASFIQNFFDNHKIIHADISRIRKNLKPSSSKPSSNNDFVSQIVHDSLLDSNDLPITTHPFYFNDQHFLIDNDHNLYDFNLHTHIGSFNPSNNSIALF